MTTELPEGIAVSINQKVKNSKKISCNAWTKRGVGEGGHVAMI